MLSSDALRRRGDQSLNTDEPSSTHVAVDSHEDNGDTRDDDRCGGLKKNSNAFQSFFPSSSSSCQRTFQWAKDFFRCRWLQGARRRNHSGGARPPAPAFVSSNSNIPFVLGRPLSLRRVFLVVLCAVTLLLLIGGSWLTSLRYRRSPSSSLDVEWSLNRDPMGVREGSADEDMHNERGSEDDDDANRARAFFDDALRRRMHYLNEYARALLPQSFSYSPPSTPLSSNSPLVSDDLSQAAPDALRQLQALERVFFSDHELRSDRHDHTAIDTSDRPIQSNEHDTQINTSIAGVTPCAALDFLCLYPSHSSLPHSSASSTLESEKVASSSAQRLVVTILESPADFERVCALGLSIRQAVLDDLAVVEEGEDDTDGNSLRESLLKRSFSGTRVYSLLPWSFPTVTGRRRRVDREDAPSLEDASSSSSSSSSSSPFSSFAAAPFAPQPTAAEVLATADAFADVFWPMLQSEAARRPEVDQVKNLWQRSGNNNRLDANAAVPVDGLDDELPIHKARRWHARLEPVVNALLRLPQNDHHPRSNVSAYPSFGSAAQRGSSDHIDMHYRLVTLCGWDEVVPFAFHAIASSRTVHNSDGSASPFIVHRHSGQRRSDGVRGSDSPPPPPAPADSIALRRVETLRQEIISFASITTSSDVRLADHQGSLSPSQNTSSHSPSPIVSPFFSAAAQAALNLRLSPASQDAADDNAGVSDSDAAAAKDAFHEMMMSTAASLTASSTTAPKQTVDDNASASLVQQQQQQQAPLHMSRLVDAFLRLLNMDASLADEPSDISKGKSREQFLFVHPHTTVRSVMERAAQLSLSFALQNALAARHKATDRGGKDGGEGGAGRGLAGSAANHAPSTHIMQSLWAAQWHAAFWDRPPLWPALKLSSGSGGSGHHAADIDNTAVTSAELTCLSVKSFLGSEVDALRLMALAQPVAGAEAVDAYPVLAVLTRVEGLTPLEDFLHHSTYHVHQPSYCGDAKPWDTAASNAAEHATFAKGLASSLLEARPLMLRMGAGAAGVVAGDDEGASSSSLSDPYAAFAGVLGPHIVLREVERALAVRSGPFRLARAVAMGRGCERLRKGSAPTQYAAGGVMVSRFYECSPPLSSTDANGAESSSSPRRKVKKDQSPAADPNTAPSDISLQLWTEYTEANPLGWLGPAFLPPSRYPNKAANERREHDDDDDDQQRFTPPADLPALRRGLARLPTDYLTTLLEYMLTINEGNAITMSTLLEVIRSEKDQGPAAGATKNGALGEALGLRQRALVRWLCTSAFRGGIPLVPSAVLHTPSFAPDTAQWDRLANPSSSSARSHKRKKKDFALNSGREENKNKKNVKNQHIQPRRADERRWAEIRHAAASGLWRQVMLVYSAEMRDRASALQEASSRLQALSTIRLRQQQDELRRQQAANDFQGVVHNNSNTGSADGANGGRPTHAPVLQVQVDEASQFLDRLPRVVSVRLWLNGLRRLLERGDEADRTRQHLQEGRSSAGDAVANRLWHRDRRVFPWELQPSLPFSKITPTAATEGILNGDDSAEFSRDGTTMPLSDLYVFSPANAGTSSQPNHPFSAIGAAARHLEEVSVRAASDAAVKVLLPTILSLLRSLLRDGEKDAANRIVAPSRRGESMLSSIVCSLKGVFGGSSKSRCPRDFSGVDVLSKALVTLGAVRSAASSYSSPPQNLILLKKSLENSDATAAKKRRSSHGKGSQAAMPLAEALIVLEMAVGQLLSIPVSTQQGDVDPHRDEDSHSFSALVVRLSANRAARLRLLPLHPDSCRAARAAGHILQLPIFSLGPGEQHTTNKSHCVIVRGAYPSPTAPTATSAEDESQGKQRRNGWVQQWRASRYRASMAETALLSTEVFQKGTQTLTPSHTTPADGHHLFGGLVMPTYSSDTGTAQSEGVLEPTAPFSGDVLRSAMKHYLLTVVAPRLWRGHPATTLASVLAAEQRRLRREPIMVTSYPQIRRSSATTSDPASLSSPPSPLHRSVPVPRFVAAGVRSVLSGSESEEVGLARRNLTLLGLRLVVAEPGWSCFEACRGERSAHGEDHFSFNTDDADAEMRKISDREQELIGAAGGGQDPADGPAPAPPSKLERSMLRALKAQRHQAWLERRRQNRVRAGDYWDGLLSEHAYERYIAGVSDLPPAELAGDDASILSLGGEEHFAMDRIGHLAAEDTAGGGRGGKRVADIDRQLRMQERLRILLGGGSSSLFSSSSNEQGAAASSALNTSGGLSAWYSRLAAGPSNDGAAAALACVDDALTTWSALRSCIFLLRAFPTARRCRAVAPVGDRQLPTPALRVDGTEIIVAAPHAANPPCTSRWAVVSSLAATAHRTGSSQISVDEFVDLEKALLAAHTTAGDGHGDGGMVGRICPCAQQPLAAAVQRVFHPRNIAVSASGAAGRSTPLAPVSHGDLLWASAIVPFSRPTAEEQLAMIPGSDVAAKIEKRAARLDDGQKQDDSTPSAVLGERGDGTFLGGDSGKDHWLAALQAPPVADTIAVFPAGYHRLRVAGEGGGGGSAAAGTDSDKTVPTGKRGGGGETPADKRGRQRTAIEEGGAYGPCPCQQLPAAPAPLETQCLVYLSSYANVRRLEPLLSDNQFGRTAKLRVVYKHPCLNTDPLAEVAEAHFGFSSANYRLQQLLAQRKRRQYQPSIQRGEDDAVDQRGNNSSFSSSEQPPITDEDPSAAVLPFAFQYRGRRGFGGILKLPQALFPLEPYSELAAFELDRFIQLHLVPTTAWLYVPVPALEAATSTFENSKKGYGKFMREAEAVMKAAFATGAGGERGRAAANAVLGGDTGNINVNGQGLASPQQAAAAAEYAKWFGHEVMLHALSNKLVAEHPETHEQLLGGSVQLWVSGVTGGRLRMPRETPLDYSDDTSDILRHPELIPLLSSVSQPTNETGDDPLPKRAKRDDTHEQQAAASGRVLLQSREGGGVGSGGDTRLRMLPENGYFANIIHAGRQQSDERDEQARSLGRPQHGDRLLSKEEWQEILARENTSSSSSAGSQPGQQKTGLHMKTLTHSSMRRGDTSSSLEGLLQRLTETSDSQHRSGSVSNQRDSRAGGGAIGGFLLSHHVRSIPRASHRRANLLPVLHFLSDQLLLDTIIANTDRSSIKNTFVQRVATLSVTLPGAIWNGDATKDTNSRKEDNKDRHDDTERVSSGTCLVDGIGAFGCVPGSFLHLTPHPPPMDQKKKASHQLFLDAVWWADPEVSVTQRRATVLVPLLAVADPDEEDGSKKKKQRQSNPSSSSTAINDAQRQKQLRQQQEASSRALLPLLRVSAARAAPPKTSFAFALRHRFVLIDQGRGFYLHHGVPAAMAGIFGRPHHQQQQQGDRGITASGANVGEVLKRDTSGGHNRRGSGGSASSPYDIASGSLLPGVCAFRRSVVHRVFRLFGDRVVEAVMRRLLPPPVFAGIGRRRLAWTQDRVNALILHVERCIATFGEEAVFPWE